MNLPEELKNWEDRDIAAYKMGQAVGIFPDPAQPLDFQVKYKHVFWSRHRIGSVLYSLVEELVLTGILEENDKEQVRWVKHYEPEPFSM